MANSSHKSGFTGTFSPQAYRKLGRYLLGPKIASGGMAVVYRAKFVGVEGFEKEFAVKKILPHWSHDPEFARMLIDEANVLVRLHHPNIVQVFELGLDLGTYFIVMEFVDGFDLRAVLRRLSEQARTLPLEILCHIAKQICLGLEFAHDRRDARGAPLNIVHRDISPQNILLSRDGQIKLTDFGIAKMTGKTTTTRSGVLKGKYAYMSPEQAAGSGIDARSDIFSLGALIYEMAAGKKCFEGENDLATLENVKRAAVNLPEGLNPLLARLISRSLDADRNARYQNASALKRELEELEPTLPGRCDADDVKDFLAELMGTEDSPGRHPKRDGPTRALPLENSKPTRPDADDGTIVATKTLLREPTVIEAQRMEPNLSHEAVVRPPPNAQDVTPSRRLIFIFTVPLLLSVILTASFMMPEPNPSELDAPIAHSSASKFPVSASKPRQEFHTEKKTVEPPPSEPKRVPAPPPPILSSSPLLFEPPIVPTEVPEIDEKIAVKKIEYGTLTVDARPWGIARIGGGRGRETPAKFTLPAGRHSLSISLPVRNAHVKRTVEIKPGRTLKCRAGFATTKTLSCSR